MGSENSSATAGFRRTLNAYCGNPIEVEITKVPSGRRTLMVGHAIGSPLRDTVRNSQVR